MNKIFKSKFNKTLGAWVAVSELAKGLCKNSKSSLICATLVVASVNVGATQVINEDVEVTESVVIKKNVTIEGTSILFKNFRISADDQNFIIDKPINPDLNKDVFNFGVGTGARVTGRMNFAIGDYSYAHGDNNFAFGSHARAKGENSLAVGIGSFSGNKSISLGNFNYSVWASVAVGKKNYSFKDDTVTVGQENVAYDLNAVAMGVDNVSTSMASSSVGVYNYAGESKLLGSKDDNGVMVPRLLDIINLDEFAYEPLSNKPEDQLKAVFIKDFASRKWNIPALWQYHGLTFTGDNDPNLDKLKQYKHAKKYIIKALEESNRDANRYQVAYGSFNVSTGNSATSIGTMNLSIGDFSNALGFKNLSLGGQSSSVGVQNTSVGRYSSALGYSNFSEGKWSSAMGYSNQAFGSESVALGFLNYAEKIETDDGRAGLRGSVAVGSRNIVNNAAIGLGTNNIVSKGSIAVGGKNKIINKEITLDENNNIKESIGTSGNIDGVVFGYDNTVYSGKSGSNNINIAGSQNFVQSSLQISVYGYNNFIGAEVDFTNPNPVIKKISEHDTSFVSILGNKNNSNASYSTVIGNYNEVSYKASNSVVLGNNIKANVNGAIYIGNRADTAGYTKATAPTGVVWAGNGDSLPVMTIGYAGHERQIQNVAAGRVTEDSTDAINGSQLYWFKKSLDEKIGKLLPAIADEKGTTVKPKDQKVVIGGGVAEEENKPKNFTTGNITSETEKGEDGDSNGKLIIKLAKNIKGLESIEVTDDKGEGTRITKDGIETKVAKKDKDGNVVKDQDGNTVYETKSMGTNFAGDDGKAVNIPLNQTLNLKGGATDVSTENNIGVVKGDNNTLNVRLAKNLKGIESIDGLKEMSYDDMQSDANKNKAVSVKSLENYLEKYGSGGTSGGSGGFNGDAGGKEITNLKPGTRHDSAATVGQVEERYDDALGASAMAMATSGLPQATDPGKSMVSVAGSTLDGKQGFALGVSTVSGNGKWVIKGSVAGSSRKQLGATIGAGYQW